MKKEYIQRTVCRANIFKCDCFNKKTRECKKSGECSLKEVTFLKNN